MSGPAHTAAEKHNLRLTAKIAGFRYDNAMSYDVGVGRLTIGATEGTLVEFTMNSM
jgi:hypothetical protein